MHLVAANSQLFRGRGKKKKDKTSYSYEEDICGVARATMDLQFLESWTICRICRAPVTKSGWVQDSQSSDASAARRKKRRANAGLKPASGSPAADTSIYFKDLRGLFGCRLEFSLRGFGLAPPPAAEASKGKAFSFFRFLVFALRSLL